MLYLTMKHLHVTFVTLSIAGFCLRGLLLMRKSALTGRRWFKVLPHINDTLLLGAGITLTVLIGQYPFLDAWLTAKFFGLVAYIILGALAFRPERGPRVRLLAGVGAVAVFVWIVSVALSKNPLGYLT